MDHRTPHPLGSILIKYCEGKSYDMLTHLCRSFYLKQHPILSEKRAYKEAYCQALAYFVSKYGESTSSWPMLVYYVSTLLGENGVSAIESPPGKAEIRHLIATVSAWKFRHFKLLTYRFAFATDCMFLCAFSDETVAKEILMELKTFFRTRSHKKLDILFSALYHGTPLEKSMEYMTGFLSDWNREQAFFQLPMRKVLVTATMSAGKSTLINALVGKPLLRTSQEVCTGHICHLYSKPFEDDVTGIYTSQIAFGASADELYAIESARDCGIASYFYNFSDTYPRICVIDTPGVNSAVKREHSQVTKESLQNISYDLIALVLNANQLGTDDERDYLKYLLANVPAKPIIFVLNKLDTFRKNEDSIEESIQGVKEYLAQLGYEHPTVLPVSAYFAMLIKMKKNGIPLNEDEEDEFQYLCKKYSQAEYDLSCYYGVMQETMEHDILQKMSIKCGLLGLESILFGGR